MKLTTLALTALLAVGILLVGCGSDDSSSADNAAGNPIDRAFAAEMIPHHQSAVKMAEIATRRGESEFVKQLAKDIIRTQNEEISTLRSEDDGLDAAGVELGKLDMPSHMKGMVVDPAELEEARPFDREFIDMMLPHHQDAIVMARMELEKGADPELKTLAEAIVKAQSREIESMNDHRIAKFGEPSPAGGVPKEEEGSGHSM